MGETSALAALIGAAILLWTGIGSWRTMAGVVVGTIAMFMVGGGILVHGIHSLDVAIKDVAQQLDSVATIGPTLATLTPTLGGVLVGVVAGALAVGAVTLWQKVVPGASWLGVLQMFPGVPAISSAE